MNQASELLRYSNPKKSENLAHRVLSMAKLSKKVEVHKFYAFLNLVYAKIELGQKDSALFYIDSTARIITVHKIDSLQYDLLVVKGYYRIEMNDIVQGLGYYYRALPICTNKKKKAALYNNIGIAFRLQKDFDGALKYFELSYQLGVEMHDTTRMVKSLNNIGNIYFNKQHYEKATAHYQQGYILSSASLDSALALNSLNGMATVYEMEKKYQKAIELQKSILQNPLTRKNPASLLITLVNIGNLNRKMEHNKEAIDYLEKALALSDSINSTFYAFRVCQSLSRYYAGIGSYKKAYQYRLKEIELNDSLVQQKIRNTTQEMEARYQNKENKKEIVLLEEKNKVSNLQKVNAELGLKQKNITLGFVATIAISIALLTMLLWYRNHIGRKHNKQLSVMLAEKNVLLQEIHHRVKNNLQLVSSLLSLQSNSVHKEDPEIMLKASQDRIHSLALLHEKLYQSEHLKMINFQEYIDELAKYLFDSFNCRARNIEIHVSSDPINTDIDQLVPCGLILNELITNSIKYAFPQSTHGQIMIQTQHIEDTCVLTFNDNGQGFCSETNPDGVGLKLVRGLVRQLKGKLNQYFPKTGGVQFTITFPLDLHKRISNR
ncbi:MAG: tetratricopeptide repeat-containing sensor histidine kinase [Bacteroidia bacterium]